jgi:hypothetical protein
VRRTEAEVVEDLNSVPVFGILTEDKKLYGTDEDGCMIYTYLDDALRVLAKVQETYPDNPLQLEPLALGTVLKEAGLLAPRKDPKRITLVPSPDASREARQLAASAAGTDTDSGAKRRRGNLARVPIFHIGPVTWNTNSEAQEESSAEEAAGSDTTLWPYFFSLVDVDRFWAEVGEKDIEKPPVQATDLASLIKILRSPSTEEGQPMLCGSLDAIQYLRERDRKAVRGVSKKEA